MYTIHLDNSDNDKTKTINLPIVPRIGDWIKIYDEDFADGDDLLTVTHVVLDHKSEIINVVVSSFG